MARQSRGRTAQSTVSDQPNPFMTAIRSWLTFTLGTDNGRTFFRLPHVVTNWIFIVVVGLAWWRWYPQWQLLSIITGAGIVYSIGRAARHLPARRKVVDELVEATRRACKHPRSTARKPVDPASLVQVQRWAGPKRPARGKVVYADGSAAASPATRTMAEQALVRAFPLKVGTDVATSFTTAGVIAFSVVDADDPAVAQRRTRGWIDQVSASLFPRAKQDLAVDIDWQDGTDRPDQIVIEYGASQDIPAAFRDSAERQFDERVDRGCEWVYDWATPGVLAVQATDKDSPAAQRKRAERRLRDIVVNAVTGVANRAAADKVSVEVSDWMPEDAKAAQNTPLVVAVVFGTSHFSSRDRQIELLDLVDEAMDRAWPDRVWSPTWQHTDTDQVTLTAVPPAHKLALRKKVERRLREMALEKLRPYGAVEVHQWRTIDADSEAEQEAEEKPVSLTVTFGSKDLTRGDDQVQIEQHFDSLYVDTGWTFDWDFGAGQIKLTEVPALPRFDLFPDVGTDAFQALEADARRGVIAFGPAKGGGLGSINFNESPHTLVGGNTGRGKSVLLTLMLFWALYLPDEYEIIVCDPKRTDFTWTPEFPNVRFAATIPEIQDAVAYAKQRMEHNQDLLQRYGRQNVAYLREMAARGEIPAEDAPRRLLLFFDEMASFFTDSSDEETRVLQGTARGDLEQITMLGRAPWVNVFGAAQKPSDKNLGTQVRELMSNKIGIGWMKANMSEQVLGSNLCTMLPRKATPRGRGWILTEGHPDRLMQTWYVPMRTEPVDFLGGQVRPGVQDMIRDRLRQLGYQPITTDNGPRWALPDETPPGTPTMHATDEAATNIPPAPVPPSSPPPARPVDGPSIPLDTAPKSPTTPVRVGEEPPSAAPTYRYSVPRIQFPSSPPRSEDLQGVRATAAALQKVFADFSVDANVVDHQRGPSVTSYIVETAAGVKISKITGLADEIAYATGAGAGINIVAPIPGRSAIGVEIPNSTRDPVLLGDLLPAPADAPPLWLPLGVDTRGQLHAQDLATLPHLLIAGATGAGKTNWLHAAITTLVTRNTPEQMRLLIIDTKADLSVYQPLHHLIARPINQADQAGQVLERLGALMDNRYNVAAVPIVIVVDELADLLLTSGRDVEAGLVRISQLGRAAGLHLLLGTQRPSSDVVTGLIKANIPARLALTTSSAADSRVILDQRGAETLAGRGDALFKSPSSPPQRLQTPYISQNDVHRAVRACVSNAKINTPATDPSPR